jgi:hypothetical protein
MSPHLKRATDRSGISGIAHGFPSAPPSLALGRCDFLIRASLGPTAHRDAGGDCRSTRLPAIAHHNLGWRAGASSLCARCGARGGTCGCGRGSPGNQTNKNRAFILQTAPVPLGGARCSLRVTMSPCVAMLPCGHAAVLPCHHAGPAFLKYCW